MDRNNTDIVDRRSFIERPIPTFVLPFAPALLIQSEAHTPYFRANSGDEVMPIFLHSKKSAHGLVHFSGIVDDSEHPSFEEQLRNVFNLLDARLKELNLSRENLIHVTVWLSDIRKQFKDLNSFWVMFFHPNLGPPRSTCQVVLSRPSLQVEVIAIAEQRE